MMMPKSETMALMIALRPAAMALTMAMMQLPIVRKTDLMQETTAPIFAGVDVELFEYGCVGCGEGLGWGRAGF